MRKKFNKEKEFLAKLEEQVSHLYNKIETNVKYKRKHVEGEIDLIGYKHEKKDVYEVKATANEKSVQRAIEQLDQARNCLPNVENTFIYIGKNNLIIPYNP